MKTTTNSSSRGMAIAYSSPSHHTTPTAAFTNNRAEHQQQQNIQRMANQHTQGEPLQMKGKTKINIAAQEINWKKSNSSKKVETAIAGKKVDALLDTEDQVKGSTPGSGKHYAIYKNYGLIKGHLLNENLGGMGVPQNLFPIDASANAMHKNNIEIPAKSNFLKIHEHNSKQKKDDEKFLFHYSIAVKNAKDFHKDRRAEFQCLWHPKRIKDGFVPAASTGKGSVYSKGGGSKTTQYNLTLNEQLEDIGWGGEGSGRAKRIKWKGKTGTKGQWEDKNGGVWAKVG